MIGRVVLFAWLFACSVGPAVGQPAEDNKAAWEARIAEAKERSRQLREEATATRDRLRAEAKANPFDSFAQLELQASEAVLNDHSLRRGDIISTTRGLFIFDGTKFFPLPKR